MTTFTPINKGRAFEAVVDQIEQAIYSGVYKPGDYLPSERALVEQFEVGRSTVREALRILENMGFVKTSPGSRKGPQVSASLTPNITRMLMGALHVEEVALSDLVEYRMIVGQRVYFLAAHLRTDDHLAEMRGAIEKMEIAGHDAAAFARADASFHDAVAEAAGNGLIDMINAVIDGAIIELIESTVASDASDAVRAIFLETHRAIYEAILKGDGQRAAAEARRSLLEAYGPNLSERELHRLTLLARS